MAVIVRSSRASHWPPLRLMWWSFWLLLVIAGVSLSYWQWSRAEQKQQLLAPMSVWNETSSNHWPQPGQQVMIRGRWLSEHSFWLDNRQYQAQVGVSLITPLQGADGRVYLVDRGFVATQGSRNALPLPESVNTEAVIEGRFQSLTSAPFVLGALLEGNRLQALQLQDWQQRLGISQSLATGVVHQSNGLRPAWWAPTERMPPQRHLGYALQWLLLALAAVGMAALADPWR